MHHKNQSMITPTLKMMLKVYEEAAIIERTFYGRPCSKTVRNTVNSVRHFISWLEMTDHYIGLTLNNEILVSSINDLHIHQYLTDLLKTGIKPITALSYINQVQQLFARWIRPYYTRLNWNVQQFPPLCRRIRVPRYTRPSASMLATIKQWYVELSRIVTKRDVRIVFPSRRRNVTAYELWFAATMMLEFAVRNSDIAWLTTSNFVKQDGRIYLAYVPRKTAHTSGRKVKWPVHEEIWRTLDSDGTLRLPDIDSDTFAALNKQMRALGFTGTKGAYELRKICIDHIYQKYGAEMAVSVSGDNIKTIMNYYADPSQQNVYAYRVCDML